MGILWAMGVALHYSTSTLCIATTDFTVYTFKRVRCTIRHSKIHGISRATYCVACTWFATEIRCVQLLMSSTNYRVTRMNYCVTSVALSSRFGHSL